MAELTRPGFWKQTRFWLSLLFFVILATFLALTFELPPKAREFPLIIGGATILLSIVDLLTQVSTWFANLLKAIRVRSVVDVMITRGETKSEEIGEKKKTANTGLLKTSFWFLAAFVLFYFLGIVISTFIFLFCFLRFRSACSTIKALAIAAGFSALEWGVFIYAMGLSPLAGGLIEAILH